MNSTKDKPILKLDWCSYEAAKYAVEHWHYSRKMPRSKISRIGVWENEKFIGAIIFGYGATPEIGAPYGLCQTEICELTRVALTNHITEVSRMLSISLKMLNRAFPGVKLVVSFADSSKGHVGGIYQAMGWLYVGCQEYHAYKVNGEIIHPRVLGLRYGVGGQSIPWLRAHIDPKAERIRNGVKYKYLYPFDKSLLNSLKVSCLPYPKELKSDA